MKLLTFTHHYVTRLGVLLDDQMVLDLSSARQAWVATQPVHSHDRPVSIPGNMLAFLQDWEQSSQAVATLVDWVHSNDANISLKDQFLLPLSKVTVQAPLTNPSKVICVGLNYRDHCREHNFEIPKNPVLFSKFPTSLIGPEDAVTWSRASSVKVDYEAELAIIIKKKCYRVSKEEAADYIAGFSVLNDISARDVQFADVQWVRGKSFDTFCPYGPYLVTANEVKDPQNLAIRCWVNDQLVQNSNTSEMIFDCRDIISFISQVATLLPGDIIATGTPDGVGSSRTPPIFLKNGDTVSVEVEGLGRLHNPCVEE